MAVLYPGKDFARVYRELEEITGDPRVIATTTDGPGLGLVIPDDVYDRWVDAQSAEPEETEAPKKRPGRPRKIQES
jgi:hypothetical protein